MRRLLLLLLPLVALTAGCLLDDLVVFIPRSTDAYELPGNRIPDDLVEEVELTASDGVRLHGLLALRRDAAEAPTVYYLHGQASHLDDSWDEVMLLWDLGWNVFAIDYRGFGRSEGEPTEEGLYLDALAGLALLRSRPEIDPERILIWGYSMGTGVASYAALESPGRALLLEAPYTSMTAQVSGAMPVGVPSSWLVDSRLDTLSRMPLLTCAVVVAHGTEDVRIPLWMGEEVYEAARDPKRFVRVEGGRHSEILELAGDRIVDALAEMEPTLRP